MRRTSLTLVPLMPSSRLEHMTVRQAASCKGCSWV